MEFLRNLLDLLFPPRDTEALVRSASIESVGRFLSPRIIEASSLGVTALLSYRTPLVRALILEAKYKGNTKAQTLLGKVLQEYLEDWVADGDAFEAGPFVLVPVPLGKNRMKERGYNQVEAVLRTVCERVPRDMSLNAGMLVRSVETKSQTTLRKEARVANVAGAFAVAGSIEPNVTYIVVDDVVTTGATLTAACTALKGCGASSVVALALAY